ncbi:MULTISPECIES: PP2C family protein-serine/threonine phosphatase [Streptomyces]|uniref:SpoIIE family protein phosphatase n=1 Tax=Streptomyces glycanivorans TaxID=3033808 RepID=A0ABY9JLJ4_9ACTN|nr:MULTISPECIES: SpoIIE family protein phosphatase [unclassified Streptomyces]WSQ81925.1 SpoIIE family protein phosphatase [Streptomyces sp. NBC_01213]TXS12546.1 protein phosphatase [Streptomyces sp. wa22]WLQ68568.1 SpoIIE family protein phosphatase [Streptomyces sp. Alt3]WSQ89254.1 SpoIIE family protein phosphatase [Streptomyces sp. NBC_01212]WSR04739.1 SpoIIE family protein phosphatase [Streptomyces sp. NBC_01208]
MKPELDYRSLFAATPSPYLVLAADLVIVDVNVAYLRATVRTWDDLVGQHVFDAFPDNPADPNADWVRNVGASFGRVLETGRADVLAMQRYDIPVVARPGMFEERWWSTVNTPVLDPDGHVAWIIHRVEDVTAFVRARRTRNRGAGEQLTEREEGMEAELYIRARELQRLNEELRAAHGREREVAVTLQESMLHSPDLARHENVAVRYLPAIGSLNVCGDWYDTVDLADGRFTVAVGDVVGHGLEAATVMGMLRSALSAASRAVTGPARALEVLGMYARSVEGALATTAVTVLVDARSKLLVYSSAGHLPPALLHSDGTYELLENATDPPLGARPEHVPRPQASAAYRAGDTLILFTDGLIERRGEDIDTSLDRLRRALVGMTDLAPARLADTLLARLGVAGGGDDDIALVVVRL